MWNKDIANHSADLNTTNQDISEGDNNREKYLTFGSSVKGPGFLHLWTNICAVCIEALHYKRIPVLSPKLYMHKNYSPVGDELWSSWSRYWDISELNAYTYKVANSLFYKRIEFKRKSTFPVLWVNDIEEWLSKNNHKVIIERLSEKKEKEISQPNILYHKYSGRVWREGRIAKTSNKKFFCFVKKIPKLFIESTQEVICIHAKPTPEIWTVVNDIVKQLGVDFWAIHIRRNDVLTNRAYIHSTYASSIPWIIANLECAKLNKDIPVFLMTDEKDSSYLLPLQKRFNIIRAKGFRSYQNLIAKYPGDNFLCFHIERLIYLHAKRRYKTATYWGGALEFIPFLEPQLEKLNYLPPHYPLPINCEKKYFSYFSLERKYKFLNNWSSHLSLRYFFAQNMLQFKCSLREYFMKKKNENN